MSDQKKTLTKEQKIAIAREGQQEGHAHITQLLTALSLLDPMRAVNFAGGVISGCALFLTMTVGSEHASIVLDQILNGVIKANAPPLPGVQTIVEPGKGR